MPSNFVSTKESLLWALDCMDPATVHLTTRLKLSYASVIQLVEHLLRDCWHQILNNFSVMAAVTHFKYSLISLFKWSQIAITWHQPSWTVQSYLTLAKRECQKSLWETSHFSFNVQSTNGTGVQGGQIPELIFY